MNPSAQMLSQAATLLQQKHFDDCIRLCRQCLSRAPSMTDFQHLLALAQQRSHRNADAEKTFRQLVAREPKRADYLLSYGAFLRAQGHMAQAERRLRKACKLSPEFHQAWHALGLLLFASDRPGDAFACARKVTALATDFAPGWELAAAAAQRQGSLEDAIQACREGLQHLPTAPRLHYSLAQLLRERCEFDAAAAAYTAARDCGLDSPDLYQNHADALLDGGHPEDALAVAESGVKRFTQHAQLQRTAARLHIEVGATGDPLARLRTATQSQPQNPELWQTLVELQKRMGQVNEAATTLRHAAARGCPETPGMGILMAQDAALRGDFASAERQFEQLLEHCPGSAVTQINFAMHLLARDQPDRAAALCDDVLRHDPFNQLALAYLTTALQLQGDDREHWLCDYESMVVAVPIPVPEPFSSREAFFSALTEVLEEQHHARSHPIEQSVRGGTQTNGFLFRLPHPLLRVLEQQIRKAVAGAIPEFPRDEQHPFWARAQATAPAADLRFAGAWSVRLRDQGYHTNHIHPEGWISSALYISLPEVVTTGLGTEGHIQFGAPLGELGLDLPPRRTVRPEVGTLVLFPSYMWHGTVPFQSAQSRITVAFDLLPPGR